MSSGPATPGFLLRHRLGRWKDLVSDIASDTGVGFEMGRREDEAFTDVVESVILDIIGEAQGELEVGKVEEVSNRGLVFGFIEPTRQGAADGYILQEVLIKKSQNRPRSSRLGCF